MTIALKLRRGTTAENDAFTGLEGEVTYDTEMKQLRVHDGETPGGKVVGANCNLTLERYVLESSGSPTYPMGDAVNVLVFINSVLAIEGDAYGIASKNIVFNQPLSAGTEICLVKFVSVGSITPSISLTLDSALSESSTNAVQNRAIAQKFAEIQASIDALYAKYAAELGA